MLKRAAKTCHPQMEPRRRLVAQSKDQPLFHVAHMSMSSESVHLRESTIFAQCGTTAGIDALLILTRAVDGSRGFTLPRQSYLLLVRVLLKDPWLVLEESYPDVSTTNHS